MPTAAKGLSQNGGPQNLTLDFPMKKTISWECLMGVGDKFRCYLASCLKPRDGHEYIDQNLDSPFFQTVHVKAHQLCGFKRQLSNLMSKMLALHSATWASKFCRHRGFGFNPSFNHAADHIARPEAVPPLRFGPRC